MGKNRHKNREASFILIFEKLFHDDSLDELIEFSKEVKDFDVNDEVILTVKGTFEKQDELDEIIKKFSDKRTIERLPKVNLAILRLALFEAIFVEDVPIKVAINEAIILAKEYAQPNDASFINGVLGSYAKSLNENFEVEEIKGEVE